MTTGRINQVTILTSAGAATPRGARGGAGARPRGRVVAWRERRGARHRPRPPRGATRAGTIQLPPLSSPRGGPPQGRVGRDGLARLRHASLRRRMPYAGHAPEGGYRPGRAPESLLITLAIGHSSTDSIVARCARQRDVGPRRPPGRGRGRGPSRGRRASRLQPSGCSTGSDLRLAAWLYRGCCGPGREARCADGGHRRDVALHLTPEGRERAEAAAWATTTRGRGTPRRGGFGGRRPVRPLGRARFWGDRLERPIRSFHIGAGRRWRAESAVHQLSVSAAENVDTNRMRFVSIHLAAAQVAIRFDARRVECGDSHADRGPAAG